MRRGVILVPEGRLVFPEMEVEENLLMGAYKEKRGQRVSELLDVSYSTFPRLKERRNKLAGSLSGGEQQMLAIGRGLMGDPKKIGRASCREGVWHYRSVLVVAVTLKQKRIIY